MWLSFVTLILTFKKQIQWGSQQEVISHGHVTLHLTTVPDSFKDTIQPEIQEWPS